MAPACPCLQFMTLQLPAPFHNLTKLELILTFYLHGFCALNLDLPLTEAWESTPHLSEQPLLSIAVSEGLSPYSWAVPTAMPWGGNPLPSVFPSMFK